MNAETRPHSGPFAPPAPPQYIHALLLGSWGTGKSHAMFTFPRIAVIDTQHGESSHFAERVQFVSAHATTFAEATKLLKAAAADKNIDTVGIDSLTPLHNECVKRHTNDRGVTLWQRVKAEEREFGDFVRTIRKHVVATAEPRDVRAGVGDEIDGKKVGANDVIRVKKSANFDDSIGHKFDYVFLMDWPMARHKPIATCIKPKDATKIARGEKIENLSFETLSKRILKPKVTPISQATTTPGNGGSVASPAPAAQPVMQKTPPPEQRAAAEKNAEAEPELFGKKSQSYWQAINVARDAVLALHGMDESAPEIRQAELRVKVASYLGLAQAPPFWTDFEPHMLMKYARDHEPPLRGEAAADAAVIAGAGIEPAKMILPQQRHAIDVLIANKQLSAPQVKELLKSAAPRLVGYDNYADLLTYDEAARMLKALQDHERA